MKRKTYKTVPAHCPGCGRLDYQNVIVEQDAMEPFVSPYPCYDCEHPGYREAKEAKWDKTDYEVLCMAARGELLDADGQPVPACVSYQGVTTYYELDLFGLREVQP